MPQSTDSDNPQHRDRLAHTLAADKQRDDIDQPILSWQECHDLTDAQIDDPDLNNKPGPDHVSLVRSVHSGNCCDNDLCKSHLWAYRPDDSDTHVIIIDDCYQYDMAVTVERAERTRTITGEQMWTIPDNWVAEEEVREDPPGEIVYTEDCDPQDVDVTQYYIPETDIWVQVAKWTHNTRQDVSGMFYTVGRVDSDIDAMDLGRDTLVEMGCSPAEAMDYMAINHRGMTQEEWATIRGVDQSTVSRNVKRASDQMSYYNGRPTGFWSPSPLADP